MRICRKIVLIMLTVAVLISLLVYVAVGAVVTESEGQVSITFRENSAVKPPPGGGSGGGSGGTGKGPDPVFAPETVTILDPEVGPAALGELPKTGSNSQNALPALP